MKSKGEKVNWDELLVEDCRKPDGTLHPHIDLIMSGAHWVPRSPHYSGTPHE